LNLKAGALQQAESSLATYQRHRCKSLEQWSAAIKNGATMPQIRERIGSSEIVPVTNPILSETIPGSSETVQDSDLIARLEAAERAIASGLGLTTREVAWIIGVNPGAAHITRAGITCTKTGKNCWLLASVKS
jgi:hypothetical protein